MACAGTWASYCLRGGDKRGCVQKLYSSVHTAINNPFYTFWLQPDVAHSLRTLRKPLEKQRFSHMRALGYQRPFEGRMVKLIIIASFGAIVWTINL